MKGMTVLANLVVEIARVNEIAEGRSHHVGMENKTPRSHHASRCDKKFFTLSYNILMTNKCLCLI